MGYDYDANLIIGVPLAAVYQQDAKTVEVTRYHEKTGKPFQKKETQKTATFLGREVEFDLCADDLNELPALKKTGLRAVHPEEFSPSYFGVVYRASESGKEKILEPERVAADAAKVNAFLDEHGVKERAKVYLVLGGG